MSLGALMGIGVGGAMAAGAFTPDAPTPVDYGKTTSDTLRAQLALLPEITAAREEYDPKLAAVDMRLAEQRLLGRAGSPGQMDLMRRMLPELVDLEASASSGRRGAEIADVERFGPRALAAMQASDPETAALMGLLARQAREELEAGGKLSPELRREVEQGVRSAQASRGMGYGGSDVFLEAMETGRAAEGRKRDARSFASSVAGQRGAMYGDPFLQILGRSGGREVNPMGIQYRNESLVPSAADPMGLQVAGDNSRRAYDHEVLDTQLRLEGYGSMMKGLSSAGSSGAAMAMG